MQTKCIIIINVNLCIFCEREVTWEDEAVSCDLCERWQHRLCFTGITPEKYNRTEYTARQFASAASYLVVPTFN